MTDLLRFKNLTISRPDRLVTKDGDAVKLTGLSFDLLWRLAEAAPNPLSNQELADKVWQRRFVDDQTIAKRVAIVRQALRDDSVEPAFIRTVRGKGYAFIASSATISDQPTRAERGPPKWAWLIIIVIMLAIATAIASTSSRPPSPILLDPENGDLRLENPERPLETIAFAQVDSRSVMIAGLPDWELITSRREVLEVMCILRQDRSKFNTTIDPELLDYLSEPTKDSDCNALRDAQPPEVMAE